MIELTPIEALCILNRGWSGKTEEELVNIAHDVIRREAKRLHLQYQKKLIVEELKGFEQPEN
jgi:hypothetical protein